MASFYAFRQARIPLGDGEEKTALLNGPINVNTGFREGIYPFGNRYFYEVRRRSPQLIRLLFLLSVLQLLLFLRE